MTCAVVVESSAGKNIDDALRWMVTNISPESATLWYVDTYGATDSLKDFPARYGLAIEISSSRKRSGSLFAGSIGCFLRLTARRSEFFTFGTQREGPLKPERRNEPVGCVCLFERIYDSVLSIVHECFCCCYDGLSSKRQGGL